MLLIRNKAYARAGLVGNPSDGYFGKTISLVLRNFYAEVSLYEWDRIEIVLTHEDRSQFRSVDELARDVRLHGYYGGIRLVKATIKKFVEHCRRWELPLHKRTFSIRYQSNIPRQVGLAGSSAIIVATLRCLMEFYGIDIPREAQASLALSVETEELGITAGLQDRVVQVYETLVYMDFSRDRMRERQGLMCGAYEPLDPALLPPLFLAYSADVSEPTEIFHNDLRGRFLRGEPAVLQAMSTCADLAQQGRAALLARDYARLGQAIDANFDVRRSICRLPAEHTRMVDAARSAGATAHFAGSGGAVLGTLPDPTVWERLEERMAAIGCRVLAPQVLDGDGSRDRRPAHPLEGVCGTGVP